MFYHKGPKVVNVMRKRTSRVVEHLEITSPTEVDQMVFYTQRILRGAALKKYKVVLLEWKQSAKDLVEDKCTLGDLKAISTEDFWAWDKSDRLTYDVDAYLVIYRCVNFEKEL